MAEPVKPRGLAALKISNPERFAEIVSKGGKASINSFNKNPELAKRAGQISGERRRAKHESQTDVRAAGNVA